MADFAWLECEGCGTVGFLSSPVELDADDAVDYAEAAGWLFAWGRVSCPDCVATSLGTEPGRGRERPGLHKVRTAK